MCNWWNDYNIVNYIIHIIYKSYHSNTTSTTINNNESIQSDMEVGFSFIHYLYSFHKSYFEMSTICIE